MKLSPIVLSGRSADHVDKGFKTILIRPIREPVITSGGSISQEGDGRMLIQNQHVIQPYPKCPYGCVGDYLWVKEPYLFLSGFDHTRSEILLEEGYIQIKTRGHTISGRNPFTMPRSICSLFLKITSIDIKKIQSLSHMQRAESGYRGDFYQYWDHKYAKQGFQYTNNPFVWVIKFRKTEEQL